MKMIFIIILIFSYSSIFAQEYRKQYTQIKGYSYPFDEIYKYSKSGVFDSTKIIEINYVDWYSYRFIDTLFNNSDSTIKVSDTDVTIPFFIIEGLTYEHGTDTLYFYDRSKASFLCKYKNKFYNLDYEMIKRIMGLLPYYHYLMFRRMYFDL